MLSCLAHLAVTTANSPLIFLVRIVWQTSVAGFFGASISYVAGRRSTADMAEAIGTLGTSGFIGIVLGTALGDRLLGSGLAHRWMFALAAGIGTAALVFGWLATLGELPPLRSRRPPLAWLLKRYHPGPVLLMGVATGFGLGLPPIFLRPYELELGIGQLGTFFYPYMFVAFFTRLGVRRLPALIGIRGMMLLGLTSLALGILSFVCGARGLAFVLARGPGGHGSRLHVSGGGRRRECHFSASLSRPGHGRDVGNVRRWQCDWAAILSRDLATGRIVRLEPLPCGVSGLGWLFSCHRRRLPVALAPPCAEPQADGFDKKSFCIPKHRKLCEPAPLRHARLLDAFFSVQQCAAKRMSKLSLGWR